MNDEEYEDAIERERERIEESKHDLDLASEARIGRITDEYETSNGGHGGAIAGVIILFVLGIVAYAYFT